MTRGGGSLGERGEKIGAAAGHRVVVAGGRVALWVEVRWPALLSGPPPDLRLLWVMDLESVGGNVWWESVRV